MYDKQVNWTQHYFFFFSLVILFSRNDDCVGNSRKHHSLIGGFGRERENELNNIELFVCSAHFPYRIMWRAKSDVKKAEEENNLKCINTTQQNELILYYIWSIEMHLRTCLWITKIAKKKNFNFRNMERLFDEKFTFNWCWNVFSFCFWESRIDVDTPILFLFIVTVGSVSNKNRILF